MPRLVVMRAVRVAIHVDRTRALEALDDGAGAGVPAEVPETYPEGV